MKNQCIIIAALVSHAAPGIARQAPHTLQRNQGHWCNNSVIAVDEDPANM
jgi:hypothetical protein